MPREKLKFVRPKMKGNATLGKISLKEFRSCVWTGLSSLVTGRLPGHLPAGPRGVGVGVSGLRTAPRPFVDGICGLAAGSRGVDIGQGLRMEYAQTA